MASSSRQQIRLFRVFGITVFLHWSWFLVAAYELDQRAGSYSTLGWNIAEYLALFAIVLLHEFGHYAAIWIMPRRCLQPRWMQPHRHGIAA